MTEKNGNRDGKLAKRDTRKHDLMIDETLLENHDQFSKQDPEERIPMHDISATRA